MNNDTIAENHELHEVMDTKKWHNVPPPVSLVFKELTDYLINKDLDYFNYKNRMRVRNS